MATRTTLTLDPDVVRMLAEEVHRQRRPFKQIVNDAIRGGLARTRGRGRPTPRFKIVPHHAELAPGFDSVRLNALADELEDEALLARAAGSKRA